jgi:hypothetical protein
MIIVHQRRRRAGFFTWPVYEIKKCTERMFMHITRAIGWTAERTDRWKLFWKMISGFTERFRKSVAENLVHFSSSSWVIKIAKCTVTIILGENVMKWRIAFHSKAIFRRCKIQNFSARSHLMCDTASFTCPLFDGRAVSDFRRTK